MTNKTWTLSKIAWFCKSIIVPIAFVFFIFWLYVKSFCFFSNKLSSADLVCSLNWKDGIFLIVSYSIVKTFSPLLDFDTIFKRFIVTLFLYSFSFAIIAFPFWVASFFQNFSANVFLHISALILIIEFIFKDNNRRRAM